MKIIQLLVILSGLSLSLTSFAQGEGDVLDKIAQGTCACMEEKDVANLTEEEVHVELGMCMMLSLGDNSTSLADLGIDITNEAGMTALGEKIGLRMVTICPVVFKSFIQEEMEAELEAEAPAILEIKGKIKDMEGDEFKFLVVEAENGRTHKFLWLRYFSGSEQLMTDFRKLKGKSVTVLYENIEAYSAKISDYYNYKEIREVKFD